MTSDIYRKLMWGILLSGCMIPIGNFQILPIVIGYLLICSALRAFLNAGGENYYLLSWKNARTALLVSALMLAAGLIAGFAAAAGADVSVGTLVKMALFGSVSGGMDVYPQVIAHMCMVIFLLFDALTFGRMAIGTVKVYKDSKNESAADTLRRNRATYVKINMVIISLKLVQGIGLWIFTALDIVGGFMIDSILNYVTLSLYLVLKVWFSMFMLRISRLELPELGYLAKQGDAKGKEKRY